MSRLVLAVFILGMVGCKSSSTASSGDTSGSSGSTASTTTEADTLLASGDISGAKTSYDGALTADATNTKAAFGAALTRMILLGAGDPTNQALDDLGQMRLTTAHLVGSSSFLTALNTFNTAGTGTQPSPSSYFPFAGVGGSRKGWGRIFSQAGDTLTGTNLQDALAGYITLVEEIRNLLEKADKANDFQFSVPKDLFSGTADIPLNRVDLKALRATFAFWEAGLDFLDSWNLPMTVGDLFDTNGNQLVSDQEIVNRLNNAQFFALKSTNKIADAKVAVTQGLQLALDMIDLLPSVTVDGIFEQETGTADGYTEIQQLAQKMQSSLSASVDFTYVSPLVHVNLGQLFSTPPDASKIDVDPFVLEGGRIRPVESFFTQAFSGIADIDFGLHYARAFTAISRAFARTAFGEFHPFSVAGVVLGGSSSSSSTSSSASALIP